MVQYRKQEGAKDRGVHAIVFAVGLAMGCNPSRQKTIDQSFMQTIGHNSVNVTMHLSWK